MRMSTRSIMVRIDDGSADFFAARQAKQTVKLIRKGWHPEIAELMAPKPRVFGFVEPGAEKAWKRVYAFLEAANALDDEERAAIVRELSPQCWWRRP